MHNGISRVKKLLLRSIRVTQEYIFSLEVHNIYHIPLGNKEKKKHTNITRVTQELPFVSDSYRNLATFFLRRGDIGFGAQVDGKVVGFVWGREGPISTYVGRETIQIPTGICEIHFGITHEAYRGRGYCGESIKYLVEQFLNMKAVGFVNSRNLAAQRMHTKLGSRLIGKIISLRVVGIKIRRIYCKRINFSFGKERDQRSIFAKILDITF